MRLPFKVGVALILFSACIVDAPGGDKSPERARATVPQVPPLSSTLGANLDGKVELAAASIQPGRIAPGEQGKVTLYFKALEELEKEYVVFIHVEDSDGRGFRLNLDHRPAAGTYPTTQWRKGETIKDEFSLQVPTNVSVRRLNLWAGLWEPQSDVRLRLRNPDAVRNDGNNRVLVAQVPVSQ
jgi:hypothetical protein